MEGAFRAHPLWAGATEEDIDSAGEVGISNNLDSYLFISFLK